MKQIAMTATLALALALPAQADEKNTDEGFNLMERGARLLFEGLVQDMEPALREMDGLMDQLEPALRGFVENMGPALGDFLGQFDDFSKYHAPEILPNGDIILRRKSPEEMTPPEGEVDL
ncbi:hypothetical protein [Planktotalea sp.]|uniref:hypothetical protein n=1 Tax=Planktotalea sp. TaxID=2029877 RepID=UPI0025EF0DE1|nr:hypothetical protein [Planktotalea sp.]